MVGVGLPQQNIVFHNRTIVVFKEAVLRSTSWNSNYFFFWGPVATGILSQPVGFLCYTIVRLSLLLGFVVCFCGSLIPIDLWKIKKANL